MRRKRSLDQVLSSTKVELRNRALFRVSCHPFVEKKVATFRRKNPYWEKDLEV